MLPLTLSITAPSFCTIWGHFLLFLVFQVLQEPCVYVQDMCTPALSRSLLHCPALCFSHFLWWSVGYLTPLGQALAKEEQAQPRSLSFPESLSRLLYPQLRLVLNSLTQGNDLELPVLLPLPSKYQGYRCGRSHLILIQCWKQNTELHSL